MTGFTHHFYPEMREAKHIVDSGAIGKPLTALDAMSITYAFVLPWYRNKDIAGGGVMMCNAVHGLDRVSWVVGQKITSVCAMVEPTTGSKAEDYGSALARFDGGMQGTFYQHWGPYHTLTCEMHIYGEDGMLRVRSWDSIEVMSNGKTTIHKPYYAEQGFTDRTMTGMVSQMTEMMEAVREGRPPEPDGLAGRHGVALVHAAYESSQRKAWVDVK
jgi:predicted dehydrogenase